MPTVERYQAKVPFPSERQTVPAPTGLAAAPAQQVAGIGGALTQIGMAFLNKLADTENMMELSTLDRNADEIYNATFQAISTEYDPDIRRQIYEKGRKDLTALKSNRPNVQNTFQTHLNKFIPAWDADYFNLDSKMRIERLRADKTVNDDYDYEHNRKFDFVKRQQAVELAGDQTPEETKFLIENFDKNSALAQSRILIGANNPQTAIKMLSELEGLSGNQLDQRDKLLRLAQQTQVQLGDDFGKSILKEMADADKAIMTPLATPLGRDALADDMKKRVLDPSNGLSLTESRTLINDIDNWEQNKKGFQDQGIIVADVLERVEDNTIADRQIRDLVGHGLSPTTAQSIIDNREIWKQHWYKESDQLFKRILGWSPELGFADEMSSFMYEATLREWQTQIKEQDAKGEEIIEIGRAVVRPYFIEHIKRTMEGQEENIPRMIELALGEPEKIEKEEHREVPKKEEPVVGETRKDDTGQMWEYIGDNKWREK